MAQHLTQREVADRIEIDDLLTRYTLAVDYYHHRLVRTVEGWRSARLTAEQIWREGLPSDRRLPGNG